MRLNCKYIIQKLFGFPNRFDIVFYKSLGKLFYAIMASDKCIRDEEVNALKNIIETDWPKSEHIENIEIIIEDLRAKNALAQNCFDEFVAYKKEHNYLFEEKITNLITKTAGVIAASYSSKNKSELIMLAKLHFAMK